MKYILLLLLASCTRYQYVSQPSKITISGSKIEIVPTGKEKVLNDTVIYAMTIKKVRY